MERIIQSLKDLLRTCMLDHLRCWSEVLLLVGFTYNNLIIQVSRWHLMKLIIEEYLKHRCVGIKMGKQWQ